MQRKIKTVDVTTEIMKVLQSIRKEDSDFFIQLLKTDSFVGAIRYNNNQRNYIPFKNWLSNTYVNVCVLRMTASENEIQKTHFKYTV